MNTSGIIKEKGDHHVFWVGSVSESCLFLVSTVSSLFRLGVFVWHEYTPQSLGLAMMTDEPCSILVFFGRCSYIMSTTIYIRSVFHICLISTAVGSGQITKALSS